MANISAGGRPSTISRGPLERLQEAHEASYKKIEPDTRYVPWQGRNSSPSDVRAKICPLLMAALRARVPQSEDSASAAASAAITTREVVDADEINSDILNIYCLNRKGRFLYRKSDVKITDKRIQALREKAQGGNVNAIFEFARVCFANVRGATLNLEKHVPATKCNSLEEYEQLPVRNDVYKELPMIEEIFAYPMTGKTYLDIFLGKIDKGHPYYAEAQYWLGLCYDGTLDDIYHKLPKNYVKANEALEESAKAGYYLAHRQLFLNITRGHVAHNSEIVELTPEQIETAISHLRRYFYKLSHDATLSKGQFQYMYESLLAAAQNVLANPTLTCMLDEDVYQSYTLIYALRNIAADIEALIKCPDDHVFDEARVSVIKGLCKDRERSIISDGERFDYLIRFMDANEVYIPLVIEHLTAKDLPPELQGQIHLFFHYLRDKTSTEAVNIQDKFKAALRSHDPELAKDVCIYDAIYSAYTLAKETFAALIMRLPKTQDSENYDIAWIAAQEGYRQGVSQIIFEYLMKTKEHPDAKAQALMSELITDSQTVTRDLLTRQAQIVSTMSAKPSLGDGKDEAT